MSAAAPDPAAPDRATSVPAAPVPVVGFDLDLTLVDSAERITTCVVAALAEHGVDVGPEDVRPTIGVPLALALLEIVPGLDDALRDRVVARYRALQAAPDAPAVPVLAGAREALEAVRAAGGRTLVISGKAQAALEGVLAETGLAALADVVVGDRFAEQKGVVLVELGATAYVGDHPGDVVAALTAGVAGLAVATGSFDEAGLRAAGATTVVADLLAFPSWLAEHVAALDGAPARTARALGPTAAGAATG